MLRPLVEPVPGKCLFSQACTLKRLALEGVSGLAENHGSIKVCTKVSSNAVSMACECKWGRTQILKLDERPSNSGDLCVGTLQAKKP